MPENREMELTLKEDKFIRINYGLLYTLFAGMVGLGIWVGSMNNSIAHLNQRVDNQRLFMLSLSSKIDQSNIHLANISGYLEAMKDKNKRSFR